MPWVTTEESHNCSSLWQHWINLLCCQGERLLFFYCCEKAQSVLDKMSGIVKPNQSPKKEQSVIMKTWYLINQNMKRWRTRGACVFGVDGRKSPRSPFLVCLISKRELKLQMDSESLGLRCCWGVRIKCFCHLPGNWGCFFAARSVNFYRTVKHKYPLPLFSTE